MKFDLHTLEMIALTVMTPLSVIGLIELAKDVIANHRSQAPGPAKPPRPPKDYTVTITDGEDFPIRVFRIERSKVGQVIGPLEMDYYKGR